MSATDHKEHDLIGVAYNGVRAAEREAIVKWHEKCAKAAEDFSDFAAAVFHARAAAAIREGVHMRTEPSADKGDHSMPEEIKAIVRKLLSAELEAREGLALWYRGAPKAWDRVAADFPNSFDTLFEWLKAEAEKPSTGQIAAAAAAKVLRDPKASVCEDGGGFCADSVAQGLTFESTTRACARGGE